MKWLAFGVIIYAVWKLRPRHLVKDLLEFEWIATLQQRRNMLPVSAEHVEQRFYRKLTAYTAAGFVSTLLILTASIAWTVAIPVAAALSALGAVAVLKCTTLYRTTTVPLYLTLCGIQGARWNTHSPARRWVHVQSQAGMVQSVTILLPKDWNATKLAMAAVSGIVTSRLPGMTESKVELSRFRVTYTRKPEPKSVPVHIVEPSITNGASTTVSKILLTPDDGLSSTARVAVSTVKPEPEEEEIQFSEMETDDAW
jgi:hypothetical protein